MTPISPLSAMPASLADMPLARGFASHIVQWARRHAALTREHETILHSLALQASLASSAGHVCARLVDMVDAHPDWSVAHLRMVLLDSGVAGTPNHPGAFPLILDDENQLYLHRYFDYESRLAQRLLQFDPIIAPPSRAVKNQLNALFAANEAVLQGAPDWQKIGAALALLRPLTILCGGPGTGKTTTVVNLLACLLTQNPACRIALAAPTGKAATRMLEALRARSQHLPSALQTTLPTESFTVHRLLGATQTRGVYRHHADNPLPLDVVIIDEASMLDLALATHLFLAVAPTARVILLGDKDQLSAVESGAVFAELSADPTLDASTTAALAALCNTPIRSIRPTEPSASIALSVPTQLRNSVVWFATNFRFSKDSGIGRLAADINAGDTDAVLRCLQDGTDPSLEFLPSMEPDCDTATLQRMFDGFAAYVDLLHQTTAPSTALFATFDRFRVLCALRDTLRGANAVNRLINRHVRAQLASSGSAERSPWYTGRPIMVLQNDYATRLFNGDIGITIVDIDGNPMVWFVESDQSLRSIAPARLPEHETAFAMTVHKSQGSEFAQVMLVLPAQAGRVLSRELLYTAVTRASMKVVVAGSAAVFCEGVERPTIRFSGLMARLAESSAAIDIETSTVNL